MKKISIKLILLLLTFCLLFSIFYTSSVYAQEDGIGQSQINPASPLYFLKSIREIIEIKFAGTSNVKTVRELEFATRRIRETRGLVGNREDLIESTLERYWAHLNNFANIANFTDKVLVKQASEEIAIHMIVLQKIYFQVSDQRAKMAIRSTVNRLVQWDTKAIAKLISFEKRSLTEQLKVSMLLGCQFLSKEASSSALNEIEKEVLNKRVKRCLQEI